MFIELSLPTIHPAHPELPTEAGDFDKGTYIRRKTVASIVSMNQALGYANNLQIQCLRVMRG